MLISELEISFLSYFYLSNMGSNREGNMIKLFALLIIFTATNVYAEQAVIVCPTFYYSSVKKTVEANGAHDKFKHCAVSCLLALRCPAVDVLELGILKELLDVVGPGNAEMNDLRADYHGVGLVTSLKAKTDKACISYCHKQYPENSCQ